MFVPPFFPFRRRGPEFYRMTCPKCGFSREYHLAKDVTVIRNPDCDHSDDPEIVEKLPGVCPKCGARLKKKKLPVIIRY